MILARCAAVAIAAAVTYRTRNIFLGAVTAALGLILVEFLCKQ